MRVMLDVVGAKAHRCRERVRQIGENGGEFVQPRILEDEGAGTSGDATTSTATSVPGMLKRPGVNAVAPRKAPAKAWMSSVPPTSELAAPFAMALPSFAQHLGVLERAGLVTSTKRGRVRTYELAPAALDIADGWLSDQRRRWEQRLDQLDDFLIKLKEQP